MNTIIFLLIFCSISSIGDSSEDISIDPDSGDVYQDYYSSYYYGENVEGSNYGNIFSINEVESTPQIKASKFRMIDRRPLLALASVDYILKAEAVYGCLNRINSSVGIIETKKKEEPKIDEKDKILTLRETIEIRMQLEMEELESRRKARLGDDVIGAHIKTKAKAKAFPSVKSDKKMTIRESITAKLSEELDQMKMRKMNETQMNSVEVDVNGTIIGNGTLYDEMIDPSSLSVKGRMELKMKQVAQDRREKEGKPTFRLGPDCEAIVCRSCLAVSEDFGNTVAVTISKFKNTQNTDITQLSKAIRNLVVTTFCGNPQIQGYYTQPVIDVCDRMLRARYGYSNILISPFDVDTESAGVELLSFSSIKVKCYFQCFSLVRT